MIQVPPALDAPTPLGPEDDATRQELKQELWVSEGFRVEG